MISSFFKNKYIPIFSLFLIIPILIFLFFFLKTYISIPLSIIILFCYYRLIKNEKITDLNYLGERKYYYIVVSVILIIWILFSGIGGFSFQNTDYNVRNAVLRDLINYDWPVVFDFSNISLGLGKTFENTNVGFVYYFTYWLPSALIGKLFGLEIANIFLAFWTFLMLFSTVFLLNVLFKKKSYFHLFFLIFFSGIDIIGCFSFNNLLSIKHLEWWSGFFQYSSNTTQLYWVFNQSVPTWLIVALILNMKNSSSIIFISSLVFCYSPFATFGMIPIAIYLVVKKTIRNKQIIKIFLSPEILSTLSVLIVFGTFYLSANSSISDNGLIWNIFKIPIYELALYYLLFIVVEILLFVILIYRDNKKDGLFILIFIELLLIPFYKMTPANDFCMRASIAPLFILMIYWIEFFQSLKLKSKYFKFIVVMLVIFSMVTPIHEISRSVYSTVKYTKDEYIKDNMIYSIGNPITEEGLELCNAQFYNKEYDSNFFSKYLARK